MAVAIRATIDVVPHRLVRDPDFDIMTCGCYRTSSPVTALPMIMR
jgi:hypothetical protein